MTGPMSSALGGASYKGAFGSTGGDIAQMIAQFTASAKEDKRLREEMALKQALAKNTQDELKYQHDKDDKDFAQRQSNLDADNTRAAETQRLASLDRQMREVNDGRDQLLDEEWRRTQDENSDLTRALAEQLGDRRGDQSDVRLGQADSYTQLKGPDENGNYYIYNPRKQVGSKAVVDPATGNLRPENPSATTGRGSVNTGAPAAQPPTAAAQGEQVSADGAPSAPVQPGAQTPQAAAHATSTQQPAAKPLKGPTPQGERNVAATFGQLKSLFSDVGNQIASVGYKPPGMLTQFGIELGKGGVIPMVPDAIERIAGNNAIGTFAPEYQPVETAYNALSTFLTQMITGAQMSQAEADRIRALVAMRSGDTQETISLRMKEAQGIIDAAEAKISPRAKIPALAHADSPPSAEALEYYKSLIKAGKTPDEAAAETDARFP